jgi:putative phosphoribosyl transferase
MNAQQAERFPDLRSAGRELAAALEQFSARTDVIVLGLVLGGALVAFEVARHLCLQLDFVIIRRLLVPHGPGSQVCAVNVAGSLVIDEELMPRPAVPESPLDYFVSDALEKLAGRERQCRGGRPAVDLSQKTVILADCGIRTGLTMRAAIGALRKAGPARIIAAVPVASVKGRAAIEALADEVISLRSREPFGHVGLWYEDFRRPGDESVSDLLE